MSTMWKWSIPVMILMVFLFVFSYRGLVQNMSTSTTSEVQVLNDVVSVGSIRGEFDQRDKVQHFDKEELVANLISQIATSQKTHGFDVEVDYVFLDEAGRITEDEDLIRGVQFRIEYWNWKDGKQYSTAEKRLAFHSLKE